MLAIAASAVALLGVPAAASAIGIEGSLIRSGGSAVKGARLYAYKVGFESFEAFATSDSSGNFKLETGPGEFNVSIAPPVSEEATLLFQWYDNKRSKATASVVTVGGESVPITVTLAAPLEISGTVIDQHTGLPLSNAKNGVEVKVFEKATYPSTLGHAYPAENGEFKVSGLYPGEYIIDTIASGYPLGTFYQLRYTTANAEQIAAGASGLTVLMEGTATIHGFVTEAGTGKPLKGITVNARNAANGEIVGGISSTSASGEYSFGVPGGMSVVVEFVGGSFFATQFYNGRPEAGCATAIPVVEKESIYGINAAMTAMSGALGPCPPAGGGPGGGGPGGGGGGASRIALAAASTLKVLAGKTSIPITCTGGSPCAVKVALTSTPLGKAARAAHAKRVSVGSANATIAANTTVRVKVKLSAAGRRLLAKHHGRIKARLSVTGTGGSAAIAQSKTVTLVTSRHH